MGLNIKNENTYLLVQKLAALTGESMTTAITNAVSERLNRIHNENKISLANRLLTIGQDCATHLKEPFKSIDHGEWLYDANGLPK